MGTMFGVGVVLDEKSLIPIGTVISVCGMVWWLGRKLQKVDDKLEQLEHSLSKLPCMKGDDKCRK